MIRRLIILLLIVVSSCKLGEYPSPVDCAGIENGMATFDNCDICICNGQDSTLGSGCMEDVEPCLKDCSG
jgi:hypothetical protein